MSFSSQLHKIRIERDLKQKELADAIGVHKSTINKYESGERFPDEIVILKIAKILQVDLNTLFNWVE